MYSCFKQVIDWVMKKKSSSEQILMLLKMRCELDAASVASALSMTKEGARQHLLKLEEEGLVKKHCKSVGVGRPFSFYSLTSEGLAKFPDTHADVTVQLLDSVRNILGENALELLISDREKQTYARYEKALGTAATVEEKLERLSQIRTEEGYIAEWSRENDNYWFIENHCPICAAATACQRFCRAELQNFQRLFGDQYLVERTQHILADEHRCVYRIAKQSKF